MDEENPTVIWTKTAEYGDTRAEFTNAYGIGIVQLITVGKNYRGERTHELVTLGLDELEALVKAARAAKRRESTR